LLWLPSGLWAPLTLCLSLCAGACAAETSQAVRPYEGRGVLSTGIGTSIGDLSLTSSCPSGTRFVSRGSGEVKADDGSIRTVPMPVNEGPGAVDMYNDCTGDGDNPDYFNELETIVVDEQGEVITAQIFDDNYYELYINGKFVARDSISFVPFSSTAVRFKAAYPITVAVHLGDWETHYGVGMEYANYNVGDAGFIARFDNGAVTDSDWKVLPVYIAPLDDPGCVVEDEAGIADASACAIRPECADADPNLCRALHYDVAADWIEPGFDDSKWQNATLYEADAVTRAPDYANYADRFGAASFIWSPSLKLDNRVLARFTIPAP